MAVKKIKVAAEAAGSEMGPAASRAMIKKPMWDAMAEVVKKIGDTRPAAEVIRTERVVPSIFPVFDYEVEAGGIPVGRVILVHGPSSEGKTPFGMGLGRSFLEKDHFFDLIDAERTTGAEWSEALMGSYYRHPGFSAPIKPGMYEDVRAHVRRWAENIAEERIKGHIPEETSGIVVVDSINKLTPKALWDELSKNLGIQEAEGSEKKSWRKGKAKPGIDGMGGRAGQIMAAFNAAWMNEIVPLMADTQTTMVLIARESVEKGEGFMADDVINVKGGRAIKYDSSLWLRIVDDRLWEKNGEKATLIGSKHTIEIRRSKVGAKKEKVPEAVYHTSNGVSSPLGFDRPRDVLMLADQLGVVELSGSYYKFDGSQLGQGSVKVLEKMRADPGLCERIEAACREKF